MSSNGSNKQQAMNLKLWEMKVFGGNISLKSYSKFKKVDLIDFNLEEEKQWSSKRAYERDVHDNRL